MESLGRVGYGQTMCRLTCWYNSYVGFDEVVGNPAVMLHRFPLSLIDDMPRILDYYDVSLVQVPPM